MFACIPARRASSARVMRRASRTRCIVMGFIFDTNETTSKIKNSC